MTDRNKTTFAPLTGTLRFLRDAAAVTVEAIDLMFNAGPKLAEVRRLASTSDAGLKARGLTRDGEMARIFDRR